MPNRDERPTDVDGIRTLLDRAFPGESVGQLVDDLRANGDLTISLVAELDGETVGHIAFSPVVCAPGRARVVQLAPLAVSETHRRQGIGAELVRTGIDRCAILEIDAILVLGDPDYYRRFGFDPALAAHLQSRWSGPHLMGLEFRSGTLAPWSSFSLAPAFEMLS